MDIAQRTHIDLPCPNCGERYPLTLAQVLLSQEMLHEGCDARAEEECPPDYFASLLDRSAIIRLQEAWRELAEQAAAAGAELIVEAPGSGSDIPPTHREAP